MNKLYGQFDSNKAQKDQPFIVLSAIFLTNAILAEIIGVKIFSLESTMGLPAAGLDFFGQFVLDFNLTAGAVIWPMVFITTDVINEYFGKKGVKKISFLTAFLISYIFLVIYLVTRLSPAPFWLELNSFDASGHPFDIDYAFKTIFRQGLGIIIGSLTAFLIAQLLDVYIFQRLRHLTGKRMIWLRATGSTLVSQLIDSFVVLGIAFYLFGNWSLKLVVAVGTVNYIYKFVVAILLTPLLYVAHFFIDRYLGRDVADKMAEQAGEDQSIF
ncbi:MAG: queuosine precursor transporter [Cyclobacteriaceae bacterium]|nr:queuosine precursor transporter [Cyclobacteriaceae bacterium]